VALLSRTHILDCPLRPFESGMTVLHQVSSENVVYLTIWRPAFSSIFSFHLTKMTRSRKSFIPNKPKILQIRILSDISIDQQGRCRNISSASMYQYNLAPFWFQLKNPHKYESRPRTDPCEPPHVSLFLTTSNKLGLTIMI
jgi:hypothetical protein